MQSPGGEVRARGLRVVATVVPWGVKWAVYPGRRLGARRKPIRGLCKACGAPTSYLRLRARSPLLTGA